MFKSNLAVLLFIAISMISCKNVEEKIPTEENIIEEPQTSKPAEQINELKSQLQGTWKRVDYPYSTYEFIGNTAKLISEGQYEEPQFDPYELSTSCRFADEFNTELAQDELVLTNPTVEAFSIVSVRQDTLRITDLERSFVIEYARN